MSSRGIVISMLNVIRKRNKSQSRAQSSWGFQDRMNPGAVWHKQLKWCEAFRLRTSAFCSWLIIKQSTSWRFWLKVMITNPSTALGLFRLIVTSFLKEMYFLLPPIKKVERFNDIRSYLLHICLSLLFRNYLFCSAIYWPFRAQYRFWIEKPFLEIVLFRTL